MAPVRRHTRNAGALSAIAGLAMPSGTPSIAAPDLRSLALAAADTEEAPPDGITVVIPARDEAVHIARCVESVRGLGRVVVVDCGSSDGTQQIARAAGAEVVHHAWQGHAAQKNWALENLDFRTPWVLFLDADEYLPGATIDAIRTAVHTAAAGFYLPRRYIFLGRPLDHAWWYPDAQLRLFRVGRGRFEDRRVHEHAIVDGAVEMLDGEILHDNLKGLSAFIERHNRYSDLEAEEWRRPAGQLRTGSWLGQWADRRRAMKGVWLRLPARPVVRFIYMYVVRRGFLDGRRGLLFCTLIAMYEAMIEAKILERKLAGETSTRSRRPAAIVSRRAPSPSDAADDAPGTELRRAA
jgi:glycosyltransferase involved in cell wall biosynthesis